MTYRAISCALAAVAGLGALAGCADLNDTGRAALASRVAAYAVVNDQLVQGEMVLYPDRTGTLTLRHEVPPMANVTTVNASANSASVPIGSTVLTSCVGRLRYTASTLGVIDLRCNEGAIADLNMALIGDTRGYGYGQTATGLVSLVFGMTPVEARAHLTVPRGRQLVERSESGGLDLR